MIVKGIEKSRFLELYFKLSSTINLKDTKKYNNCKKINYEFLNLQFDTFQNYHFSSRNFLFKVENGQV